MNIGQKTGMRVALCDDEEVTHMIVEKYLEEWAREYGETYELHHFFSGEEVLEAEPCWDILFLDIRMPGIDGIETAHRLNQEDRQYKIVIITCIEEVFKEAFRIGAYRFVTKPICTEEIWEALSAVRASLLEKKEVIVFRDKKKYSICQKDIFYISGKGSETEVYTKAYSFRSDLSLNGWEKQLDEKMFFRCHRSYIVNLSKIKEIDEKIHLLDGEMILLSRRRRRKIEERFSEYESYNH